MRGVIPPRSFLKRGTTMLDLWYLALFCTGVVAGAACFRALDNG